MHRSRFLEFHRSAIRRYWENSPSTFIPHDGLQICAGHEHEVAKWSTADRSHRDDLPAVLLKGNANVAVGHLEVGLLEPEDPSVQLNRRWSTAILPTLSKARRGRRCRGHWYGIWKQARARYWPLELVCELLAIHALRRSDRN